MVASRQGLRLNSGPSTSVFCRWSANLLLPTWEWRHAGRSTLADKKGAGRSLHLLHEMTQIS
jgi:hypothetical protein